MLSFFSDGVDGLVAEGFFAEAVEVAADLQLTAIGFHSLTPFPFPGGGLISPFVSLQRREWGLWQRGSDFLGNIFEHENTPIRICG